MKHEFSVYDENDKGPASFGPRRLFKGGGGGSSTTVQNIPDELKPLAKAYTSKAIDLGNQAYQPWKGTRFEDFNQTQQRGLGMMEQQALDGNSVVNTADSALGQMIGGQENPYLDAMVNKAQANVMGNANAAGARSGSFGNSGIAEMAARQMGDVATSMYGQAYDADANRRLQAIGMAPQINEAGYQDAQQLLQAGQMRQDQAQQERDYKYQQYQDQQNLPYQQLAAMSGVFGSNLGGTSTTQQSGGGK
jgi:hypothetical protein